MSKLEGRVALITGAARGPGRSHAVKLAAAGAHTILVDVPRGISDTGYPSGTDEELQATAAAVEKFGRRAIRIEADVRDLDVLDSAVSEAVTNLGRLDIVSANAGIASKPYLSHEISPDTWRQMIDINLTGVWHTARAAIPHILAGQRGGAIVLTSSAAGLKGFRPYLALHGSQTRHRRAHAQPRRGARSAPSACELPCTPHKWIRP
jgi:NAD(P)-dependent dehydrogenase (short-subunit alcohol dehydrogenase family)